MKRALVPICLALLLGGCSQGLLYTHTISPLSTNMDRTPTASRTGSGKVKHLQYYTSVTWDSNAIGRIANESGIETIYFADLETHSVLLGIWRQFTVHVYGE